MHGKELLDKNPSIEKTTRTRHPPVGRHSQLAAHALYHSSRSAFWENSSIVLHTWTFLPPDFADTITQDIANPAYTDLLGGAELCKSQPRMTDDMFAAGKEYFGFS